MLSIYYYGESMDTIFPQGFVFVDHLSEVV